MSKNVVFFLFILILISGCSVRKPKDFTYRYSSESNTGLDKRIDINGYYTSQRECDSTFSSVFMFYPDGLFVIATGTDLSAVIECFKTNKKSTICSYPSWGVYRLDGDTIRTQTVQLIGSTGITVFRDYVIEQDGSLINTSDYVYPDNSNVGHLKNYPSFSRNSCSIPARFRPLEHRTDSGQCPLLKLKWFVD